MKMKTLASIINPMSEEKSVQAASPGVEGKPAGFAQFASPKKGNEGASAAMDAFAQIVNNNKKQRSVKHLPRKHLDDKGVGEKVVSSQKRAITDQPMNEAKSLQGISLDVKGVGEKAAGLDKFASLKKRGIGEKAAGIGASEVTKRTTEKRAFTDQLHIGEKAAGLDKFASSKKRGIGEKAVGIGVSEVTKRTTEKRAFTDQPMNEAKSLQAASLDDKGVGEKAASSKKRSGDVSEVTKLTTEKRAFTDQPMNEAKSLQDDKGVGEKATGLAQFASSKKRGIGEKAAGIGETRTAEKRGYTDQKYFVWRQSDAIIYKGWLANARTKYSEIVSIARRNWEIHNRRDIELA